MDVACIDIGVERSTGGRIQVAVACGIDHDLGQHGTATLLAFKGATNDLVAVKERCSAPGVVHQVHAGTGHHVQ